MPSPAVIRARRVASTALAGAARALGGAAGLVGRAAESVKPGTVTADDIAEVYEMRGRVTSPRHEREEPDAEPGGEAGPTRTSASTIEALADKPASDIVAAVDDLSTDELRLLLEHEQTHKRRKTVLAAIEQAAAQHVP